MPHSYNTQAFRLTVAQNGLLELYCALVVLEISLKDRMTTWSGNHDVPEFVTRAGETALGQRLRTALVGLWCTDRWGGEAHVAAERYPDLRYLRHESDFAGKTSDRELLAVLQIVRDIEAVLRAKGKL